METEIELKFFVSPDITESLYTFLENGSSLGHKVLQQRCRMLGNVYFDTPDHLLRQHDIGLRVRRYDDVYVQTVKTAGRVVAGLHQRPEYNAELDDATPDLSLVDATAWPEDLDIDALAQQISPLFSTDFERQQWLLGMPDGSQIEVALDQGQVTSGDLSDPICELELELKSGQTDALFTLAREFCQLGAMRLGNLSKAARGYRLATNYQGDAIYELPSIALTDSTAIEETFVRNIEAALEHWHHHEQIYTERFEHQALEQISQAICFIRQQLAVFGEVIPRRASAILRQEFEWLEGELSWLQQANQIDFLLEDRASVLRKLNAHKQLQDILAEYAANELPSQEEMLALLNSSRYCGLLLDLSRWLLSRGWQPFLDDKARQRLASPVKPFADEALTQAWHTLRAQFGEEIVLDRNGYQQQARLLSRNLLTGVAFADLYDSKWRQVFRDPWRDLLLGVEEISIIDLLNEHKRDLEEEDCLQFEKWIERKESYLLYAMEQTRAMALSMEPYWEH
ncbi:Inorganic triphosphatase [Vibrio stylophorae]|uniref:Inorganic triphosphatase n=1 Tax=Vibrio stylophorae TaxID=659351 RepID=A0ABN8DMZ6_9VIBR|nr:inorganic triphosphatase [Vibrio stylophorae]CAH0532486.1 Inorganic triphosphatase [Vibrio stylophorae]